MIKQKHPEGKPIKKVCECPTKPNSKKLNLLVKNPTYICGNCGRYTATQESLCWPERLFSTW